MLRRLDVNSVRELSRQQDRPLLRPHPPGRLRVRSSQARRADRQVPVSGPAEAAYAQLDCQQRPPHQFHRNYNAGTPVLVTPPLAPRSRQGPFR